MITPGPTDRKPEIGQLNYYDMFKNNIKIALRVFNRDKGYALINIIGMSTGLAIALLIIQYVRFELSYEKLNPLADRLVRITVDYMNGNTLIDQDCETYPPLGPRITAEFSEVVDFTRTYHIDEKTIKATTSENSDVHLAQGLNYLQAYKIEKGLLINFGAKSLEVKRLFRK